MLLSPLALLASLFLAVDEPAQLVREAERQVAEDVRTLQTACLPTDGPGLVRFFRNQTVTEPDEKQILRLMRALADKSFNVRARAATDLTSSSPAVLPLLRRRLGGTDLETRLRLERCIRLIEGRQSGGEIWGTAARRLEALRPDGACSALLAYLPAAGEQVQEELLASLLVLGAHDGKLEPALLKALTDPAPHRRGAAALVVAWHGDAQQRDAVRRLLRTDPESAVVVRAAEGLLAAGDVAPIPVLLDLLATKNDEVALRADDLLRWAAGITAPLLLLRFDASGRRECQDAWQSWWQQQKDRIHLSPREPAALTPQARRAARLTTKQFIQAIRGAEVSRLWRWTDPPFLTWDTGEVRHITDPFALDGRLRGLRGLGLQWHIGRVFQLSEYLTRRMAPGYHQLLAVPGSRLCIVFVEFPLARDVLVVALFVRVARGQARVVGLDQFRTMLPARKRS